MMGGQKCALLIAAVLALSYADCTSKLSWIFQTSETLGYCHMAMIEQMGDGTLVAAFQAAKTHESYNDQAIYMSLSMDEGSSWSNITQVVSGGDYAVWGPVLHWNAVKGELVLFYSQSGSFDQRSEGRSDVGGDINVITSQDGQKWGPPRTVLPYKTADGIEVPKVTANKPIVLTKSSAWLLPFWQTPSNYNGPGLAGKQAAGVLRSTDGGETFQPHYVPSTEKVIENTLAETRNGSILQLFRTGTGHLYEAWSHDAGESWTSTAPSSIPNPNAKTFLFTDASGDQILAYNPTTKGRNPLGLARSTDNGASFTEFCNLDPSIKSKALEYPTAIQVGSKILTVFSADHYTGIKLSVTEVTSQMESPHTGCTADADCSLNGVCNSNACTCDAGWTGDKCQTLDLIPGEQATGYRNIGDPVMGNTSSWGGGSWYDEKDAKWYMWATELSDHCGMHTWTTNSQTIRASSSTATGLYKREALQFGIWSHEVVVTRGPAGEYVAFFSYNPNPGASRPVCKLCTDGSTNPQCKKKSLARTFIEDTDPTYMSWSATATGNWSEPVLVLGPSVVPKMTPMDTNMAAVIRKDGALVGMWRDHHPTGKSVPHLVTASNWKDPSTYKYAMDDLLFGKTVDEIPSISTRRRKPPSPSPSGNPGGLEDMFLWVDARGHFHAIFHQMYECVTCTAHAFSIDGTLWIYTGTAATADTTYTDGSKESFTYCERPHMIFDKDGTTPVALTNGVKIQGLSNYDQSFTLLRPLRQKGGLLSGQHFVV